ncbi:metal-dependent transcriptional regulator [Balneolaceae bacterium ANBcel3]|nr:metal-dependent transcriptional regulator [Balneolaceae bacterium ANBcel3]
MSILNYNRSNNPRLSESQEDYLKEIFKLNEVNTTVSLQDLADRLKVKPASVTGMMKKLKQLGLVTYEPYKEVALTDVGEAIALEVLRHHRLLELYLARHLNYSWDEIHEEAERLEHVISEKFEAAIAELMGHPTHDPHGDPIPTIDLEIPDSPNLTAVTAVKENNHAIIRRVMTQDSDILNMLSRLDLTIHSKITVTGKDNAGIRIRVNENQYLLPHSIARFVWVELASNI